MAKILERMVIIIIQALNSAHVPHINL